MTSFLHISIYISEIFILVVAIVGLRKYKQLSMPLHFLVWYVCFEVVIALAEDVMARNNIRSLWLLQCFDILELLLFIKIYYYWRTNSSNGKLLWLSYIIYLIIWIIGKFTFEPLTYSNVYSGSISQLIQICFGTWLLLAVVKEDRIFWKDDTRFWVVSGIVLYAASTFGLFALFNQMLTLPRYVMRRIWMLNMFLVIIENLFFLRAFLCQPKRENSKVQAP
jgi:hypothetical protein